MEEILMTNEKATCEYFCLQCGQLRLSFDKNKDPEKCWNCGSMKLVVGEINGLDKESLKNEWRRKQQRQPLR